MKTRFVVVLAALVAAAPVHAADRLSGPQTAAACAPVPASTLRETALRIVGAQDVVVRELYSARTHVVIAGGTAVDYNQTSGTTSAASRPEGFSPADRGSRQPPDGSASSARPSRQPSGSWSLRATACWPATSCSRTPIRRCLPAPTLTAAVGEPDFKAAGRVLSGENERETGTRGDFFLRGCPTCRPVDRRAAGHLSRSADARGAAGGDCRCGGDRDLRRVVGRADHLRARCGPERRPGCAAAGALTYPALRRSRGMEISSTRRLSSRL